MGKRDKLKARRNAARGLASLIKDSRIPDGAATKVVTDPETGEQKIVVIDPITGLPFQEDFSNPGQEENPVLRELEIKKGITPTVQKRGDASLVDMIAGPNNSINMDIRGTFTKKDEDDVSEIINEIAKDNTGAPEKGDPIVNVPVSPPSERDVFNKGPTERSSNAADRIIKQRVNMDIDGTFIAKEITNAIKGGDLDLADELMKTGRQAASFADSFRKDLSPEAMLVDRLRARQERRLGKPETNQLTNTRQFEGEKRSPFDLDKKTFRENLQATSLLGNLTNAKEGRNLQARAIKNKMEVMLSDLNNKVAELKLVAVKSQFAKSERDRKDFQNFINRSLSDAEADLDDARERLRTTIALKEESIPGIESSTIIELSKEVEQLSKELKRVRDSTSKQLNEKAVRRGTLKKRLIERGAL